MSWSGIGASPDLDDRLCPMTSATVYRVLADLVLCIHWSVVVFVVGGLLAVLVGGLLRRPWVRYRGWRIVHLIVLLWVVGQAWLGKVCFLTTWEMALRARAGDATYAGSMIAHHLGEWLYIEAPAWAFTVAYTLFGLLVVASWVWVRPTGRPKPAKAD